MLTLIQETIESQYDIPETSPIVLLRESDDNYVYSIGKSNKKILRISKRLLEQDIRFEYEAIAKMLLEHIPAPTWLATKTGNFYSIIDGKVAIIFDFIDGHHVQVDKEHLPTPREATAAGEALGQISNFAATFKPSANRRRNIWTELNRALIKKEQFLNEFEGGKEFISQVESAIEFAETSKAPVGFIHNDYRPGNVFFNENDEVVGIIDFDWSCTGPIIKDLALAIVEWSFPDGANEPTEDIFNAFLRGYNTRADHKFTDMNELLSWIRFATLSDACTYFCDLAEDANSTKRIIKSYMYRKYLYYLDK